MNCLVQHLLESYQTLLDLSKVDPRSQVVSVLRGIVTRIDEIQISRSTQWPRQDRKILQDAPLCSTGESQKRESS